jgi:hypothetical protein
MNVDELLSREGSWTPEEMAFIEQEALKLARQLEEAVAEITADIGPEHQDLVRKLRGSARRTVTSIEAAIALDER